MQATVRVDISDVLDLASAFVDGRAEAERLTKRLVNVVAADSRERFAQEGPGWPARKETEEEAASYLESSLESARAKATKQVGRKLWREYRRAQRKFSAQAADRRYQIWREYQRLTATEGQWRSSATIEESEALQKQLTKVKSRLERAVLKQHGKLLRGLAGANKRKVRGTSGEVRNVVPWSAVQDEGGTVGNGAQIPARPFLGGPELERKLDEVTEDWMSQLGAD